MQDEAPLPDVLLILHERDARLRAALRDLRLRLGDIGWDIITRRVAAEEPATLASLGNRWGYSNEYIRILEMRTRSLLQRYFLAIGLER